MMQRVALSPKKQQNPNILPSSPLDRSCPSSPTKKPRLSRTSSSPRKTLFTPTKTRSTDRSRSPSARRTNKAESHQSPLRILSDVDVYATDLGIDGNDTLKLECPSESRISPSPRKRKSPTMSARATLVHDAMTRGVLNQLQSSTRQDRHYSSDRMSLIHNAFLTPPRPRVVNLMKPDDRLVKSASPKFGRIGCCLEDAKAFTIYTDEGEYYASVNTIFEHDEGVNKENEAPWKQPALLA